MKKLLLTSLPSANAKAVFSIQGHTQCYIAKDGSLKILHGNLEFNYAQKFSHYLSLVEKLIDTAHTLDDLDAFIQQTYKTIQNAWIFLRSLLLNGIVIVYYDNKLALDFHKHSSFGHFIQPTPGSINQPPTNVTRAANTHFCDGVDEICRINDKAEKLASLLRKRISTRTFNDNAIKKQELDYILWSSSGVINNAFEDGMEHRTVPSAGGLYPIKIYVACWKISGLSAGVYQYKQSSNELVGLDLDIPDHINSFFITKHVNYQHAACIIFLSSYAHCVLGKYGTRGYRYTLLEAGHIAQNISLACIACDLGSVMVGGFDDDRVNSWLGLPIKAEHNLYSVVIGK